MILLAFVIDRGRIYTQRTQLQNAVDAAALAAVQETCVFPFNATTTQANAKARAVEYGTLNQVPIAAADVLVFDDGVGATTGVSVAASSVLNLFFGGFVGTEAVTVAARATATRTCTQTYQYVADNEYNFNGSGTTIAGNIYAGRCFEGSSGTYNTVAVSTGVAYDCSPFHNGATPIRNGSKSPVCVPGSVRTCVYSVQNVSTSSAILQRYPNIATSYPAATSPATSCSALTAASYNAVIDCTGDVAVPSGTTIRFDVVATGDIITDNNTAFGSNPILLYSKNGQVQLKMDAVPTTVTVYAPTDLGNKSSITYTGSGAGMEGVFLGYDITVNGGGATGSGGVQLRSPGPWTLSQ
jgi:hypothetical protein